MGVLLLVGLLTPFAASASGVLQVTARTFADSASAGIQAPNEFAAFLVAVAIAAAILGPGAYSLDARLFGLREIIIPRSRPADPHNRDI